MATEIEQLDNICWEIELLAELCGTNISLDKVQYIYHIILITLYI